ncbi:MAG: hypothetical protein ACREA0_26205 [bacterium]
MKVLIDDLLRESKERDQVAGRAEQIDLFADFNGIPASGTTAYVTEQWGRRWITIDNGVAPASEFLDDLQKSSISSATPHVD